MLLWLGCLSLVSLCFYLLVVCIWEYKYLMVKYSYLHTIYVLMVSQIRFQTNVYCVMADGLKSVWTGSLALFCLRLVSTNRVPGGRALSELYSTRNNLTGQTTTNVPDWRKWHRQLGQLCVQKRNANYSTTLAFQEITGAGISSDNKALCIDCKTLLQSYHRGRSWSDWTSNEYIC